MISILMYAEDFHRFRKADGKKHDIRC
jgi:hypothetical protein